MAGLGFLSRLASKILDFDSTVLPERQFALIQDLIANQTGAVQGKNAGELLGSLKRKHLVNSITVRRLQDSIVFSSSGNGFEESENGADVMNFVGRVFGGADFFSFRARKEWVMLFPWQNSLYVIKANSAVSAVELKAIAKEIEGLLKRKKLG